MSISNKELFDKLDVLSGNSITDVLVKRSFSFNFETDGTVELDHDDVSFVVIHKDSGDADYIIDVLEGRYTCSVVSAEPIYKDWYITYIYHS